MFEQAFKNIDGILRKEAGCTTELDYTEQTSWLLFLKYLDGLEEDKADEAALEGKKYTFILDKPYRWDQWAAPKGKDGKLDHNQAMTGDDLRDFVNQKLFPYLHGFKEKATGPNTIEYKIGEIFAEIKNKISSGYNLREIIDHIDELRFRSQTEKHELSHLYEAKIKNMGNAGRNGGEYYTPRPLIRAMVQVVRPQIGERIYDGACGSAGFLCESFVFMKAKHGLTTRDLKTLQERTFFGKEKKSLAYVIAIMNMILHGIEAPNIVHTNTLTENLADIQEKDRFDVVLANPPFGGQERPEVQQNFPIRTGETAFLFLQHFIKMLKAGGRGGVVIKNTFLSNTDNASVKPIEPEWFAKLVVAEVSAFRQLWDGNFAVAALEYRSIADDAEPNDKRLAAWFRHWEGLAYDLGKEDDAAARAYIRAANSRVELGRPTTKKGVVAAAENVVPSAQAKAIFAFLKKKGQKALDHLGDVEKALGDGSQTNTVEQALADLGICLGLEASRPDHASGSGPDVLWRHGENRTGVALEAKTNKKPTSQYTKKDDIGQFHDHLGWLAKNHKGESFLKVIVGPKLPVSHDSNPPADLRIVPLEQFAALARRTKECLEVPAAVLDEAEKLISIERGLRDLGLVWPICIDSLESFLAIDLQGNNAEAEEVI